MQAFPQKRPEQEQRLLRFAGAAPGPEAKPQLPEALKTEIKEVKNKLDTASDAVKEALKKVEEATKEQDGAKGKVVDSLKATAKVYFEDLTKDGKKSPEDAIKDVQQVFGKSLHCTLDDKKELQIEEHIDFKTDPAKRLEQEGFSKEEAKDLADTLKTLPPAMQRWIQRHADKITPETKDEFKNTLENIQSIPKEQLDAASRLGAQIKAGRRVDTSKLSPELAALYNSPAGNEALVIMGESASEAKAEDDKELSEDERKKIMEEANKILEKYDPTKATEEQKNIMLARLQMAGVDADQSDISVKPPKIVPFEGTKFARSFNRFAGVIGVVALHIKKVRDTLDKTINRKSDDKETAPGGAGGKGPEGTGAGEVLDDATLRKDVQDKNYGTVHDLTTEARDKAKKKLDWDPAAGDEGLIKKRADLQAKVEPQQRTVNDAKVALDKLKPGDAGYDAAKTKFDTETKKLADLNTDIKKLSDEIGPVDEEVKKLDGQAKKLEEGKKKMDEKRKDISKQIADAVTALGNPPTKDNPDAQNLLQYLSKVTVDTPANDAAEKFQVQITNAGGDEAKAKEALVKLGIDAAALDADANGLKNPDAFKDAIVKATDSLKSEAKKDSDAEKKFIKKGSSPAAAKEAVLLQQKYGLSLKFEGTWQLNNQNDGATVVKMCRALTERRASMNSEILKHFETVANINMKDITTDIGKITFRNMQKMSADFSAETDQEAILKLAGDQKNFYKTIEWTLAGGFIWTQPDGATKDTATEIKTKDEYKSLSPNAKATLDRLMNTWPAAA